MFNRPRASSLVRLFCAVSIAGIAAAASLPGDPAKTPRPVPVLPDAKAPAASNSGGVPRGALTTTRAESATATTAAAGDRVSKPGAGEVVAPRARRDRFQAVHVVEQTTDEGDVEIWARGRGYKARFAADGATCVPFLGSTADRNHPVRFALARASVGGIELELDAHAQPTREGASVAYARGALVERWSWSDETLEHTFAFESLPAAGDLVIDVAVDTGLTPRAEAAADRGAIRFEHALGRLDYGAAIAIDADGRRFLLTSVWKDGTIEMRLDADAVASARFPLLVDPIVSTFAVDTTSTDDFAPDTAYEAVTDSYLIVEESAYSATDHDVYVTRVDAAGNVLYANWLDVTFDDWRRPRVASNALAQNFLCVAAVTPSGGGLRRIRGATFAAQTNVIGAQFTISGAESGDKLNPDVGGDPVLVGPTYYMVVWQRTYSASDQDIHARRVGADGTLSPTIFVENSSSTLDTYPAISKSDGHLPYATQCWTIVWQRFWFGVQEQVYGAQYAWDGSVTNATFPIDLGDECLRPTVSSLLDYNAGFGRAYMVAFQVKRQGQSDWDIVGALFEGTQFMTGTNITNQVSLATLSSDQIEPCVDSDGQHFSVAWSELYAGSFGDWDVFVADLVYAGGYPYLCEWDTFAYTTLQERAPRLTSTYSGNGARRRYLGTWSVLDQYTPGATHDVYAGLWDGCEGGFAESFCSGDGSGATACPCSNFGAPGNGCASSVNPNGANLGWSGNPWVANDSFTLQASGMPNSSALYFQGTAPSGMWSGTLFGDGLRCVGGSVVRIGTKQNVGGASQYPEAGDPLLSTVIILPSTGTSLFYQVWYRNAAAYCTTSTFNLTNGVYAIWGPAQ